MKKIIFILIFIFLLIGASVQYMGLSRARDNLSPPDLGGLIPQEIPGWVIEDKPIAESPELMNKVEQILNFDSAVFRSYKQGDLEISVYIAYWLPGKVPVSIVDAHTPDICWVANGWQMERLSALADYPMKSGTRISIPNYRKFHMKFSSDPISVIYWHFDGQHLREQKSRREGAMSSMERVKNRLAHFRNIIFSPPAQQVFIRISSNKEISQESVLGSIPVQACFELQESLMAGEQLYLQK